MKSLLSRHIFAFFSCAAMAAFSENFDKAPEPTCRWLTTAKPESDAVIEDSCSGRIDGRVLSDTVRHEESTPFGGALVFDGTDDESVSGPGGFAIVPLPDGIDFEAGFSIALWARLDAASPFSPFVSRTTDPEIFTDGFCLYSSDGVFGAFVSSSLDEANILAGPAVATNAWTHLCLNYDGAVTSLYVDGAFAASTTNATGTAAATGPLVFGTVIGKETAYPLTGAIADVRLFMKSLSSLEISSLYAQMAKGFEDTFNSASNDSRTPLVGGPRPASHKAASYSTPSVTAKKTDNSGRRLCVGVRRRPTMLRVATPLE